MKRIAVLSPFAASEKRGRLEHALMAERLCLFVVRAGHAPFASHAFYPLFLDEDLPSDRGLGLACEHRWLEACEEVWVWDEWGISSGMKDAIEYVERINANGNPSGHCAHCSHIQISILYFSKGEIPDQAWNGVTRG